MLRKMTNLAVAALFFSSALTPIAVNAQDEAAKPTTALPSIVVTPVVKKSLTDLVTASGTIRPVDEVYVQPLVEGLSIEKINVDIGDVVTEGQVLAELSKDSLILQKSQYQANRAKAEAGIAQYKAQVIEANANFIDAQRQSERAEKLSTSGSGSQSQSEKAVAAADIARARLEAAKQAVAVGEADLKLIDAQLADVDLRLSRTEVKAPVAGVVSQRTAKIGAIASASANPLFTLIKDNAIELVADLSETDVQKVKAGQKANVMLAGEQTTVEGTIRLVSPTVDAQTRLAAVYITVPHDGPARSGMFGSANIIVSQTDALALPISAVSEARSGAYTRLVKDNVVEQVAIKIGVKDNGFVEIIEGINDGDLVVEKAGAFVRDGDRVNPVQPQTKLVN